MERDVHRFLVLGPVAEAAPPLPAKRSLETAAGRAPPPPTVPSAIESLVWAQPVALPGTSLSFASPPPPAAAPAPSGEGHQEKVGGSLSRDPSWNNPVVLCLRESWREEVLRAGDTVHVVGGLFPLPHRPGREPPPPPPPSLALAPTTVPRGHASGIGGRGKQELQAPQGQQEQLAGVGMGVCARVVMVDDRQVLVLDPDTLLPPTRISTNTSCARRFVLQHKGATGLNFTSEVTGDSHSSFFGWFGRLRHARGPPPLLLLFLLLSLLRPSMC